MYHARRDGCRVDQSGLVERLAQQRNVDACHIALQVAVSALQQISSIIECAWRSAKRFMCVRDIKDAGFGLAIL